MDEYESLSHSKWELRRHLGEVFRKLAQQKESRIEEGHLMPDHVHMMISIPPKYAVSQVVGFIKGKSAIHLARVYGEKKRNFVGQHFWARGYFVSTVGRDEAVIREYIRKQEQEDSRLEQMNLWRSKIVEGRCLDRLTLIGATTNIFWSRVRSGRLGIYRRRCSPSRSRADVASAATFEHGRLAKHLGYHLRP
jgi:putative transposase